MLDLHFIAIDRQITVAERVDLLKDAFELFLVPLNVLRGVTVTPEIAKLLKLTIDSGGQRIDHHRPKILSMLDDTLSHAAPHSRFPSDSVDWV